MGWIARGDAYKCNGKDGSYHIRTWNGSVWKDFERTNDFTLRFYVSYKNDNKNTVANSTFYFQVHVVSIALSSSLSCWLSSPFWAWNVFLIPFFVRNLHKKYVQISVKRSCVWSFLSHMFFVRQIPDLIKEPRLYRF